MKFRKALQVFTSVSVCKPLPPTRVSFVVYFLASAILSACVILPIPGTGGEVISGREIENKDLLFIETGKTLKSEIVSHLGEPTRIWEEENVHTYDWRKMLGLVFVALPGGGDIKSWEEDRVLLLQFDEFDRVKRYELSKPPYFSSYGDFLRRWVRQSETLESDGDQKDK